MILIVVQLRVILCYAIASKTVNFLYEAMSLSCIVFLSLFMCRRK